MTTDRLIESDPSITLSPSRTTTNRAFALQAETTRRRRRRIVGGLVFGIVVIASAVAVWDPMDRGDRPMPSDAEVRQVWQAHRADFEALRSMLDADRNLTVVGEDRVENCRRDHKDRSWACPNASGLDVGAMLQAVHLSVDRYALYRKHLGAVAGHSAARRDPITAVSLYASGIAPAGVVKSVVWSPTPPAPVVADTDSGRAGGRVVNYAALADGWYIEHESN
jgi:hypothetical protein